MKLRDPDLLRTRAFVGGKWVDATGGATHQVMNPATREPIGVVPGMGAADARRAIEAAAQAFPEWAAQTAKERAVILRRWYELLMANLEDLSTLMTAEQGKPFAESKGEIAYAASFSEWLAEEGKRLYGDVIPGHQTDKRILVLRQPVGVVAAITPWNFPLAMITRKAGPALAAGCTFVCKPASQTPYSALAAAALAARAGVPAGVLNVITGDAAAIGGEMTSNTSVRKVTFTGSTAVGKKLMAQCAGTVKKLSLELGGTFFERTVLTDVTAAMLVAREETFGPVAPLFRFETEGDAIRMANDTEFGLAAYFYTRDLARSWRVAEALEYGIVGLNTGIISTEVAPFGGVKESGTGREGSKYGILDYTELKYLCVGIG